MPAIVRNLQSKCIEIIQFAFMCTICTRVQIFAPPRRQEQICTRGQIFAPGCKFLKYRSHGQKYTPGANQICTRVQIAHMNEAYGATTVEKVPLVRESTCHFLPLSFCCGELEGRLMVVVIYGLTHLWHNADDGVRSHPESIGQ